jgi:hypothetical protein
LGRTVLFTFIALFVCAGRAIAGFGEGAKGQDAAFMLVLVLSIAMVSLGVAIAGAMILGETHQTFADWFRTHKLGGLLVTLLSILPIGLGLGIIVSLITGIILGIWSLFNK